MIEAKMESPVVLKKILDAIKELVSDANFECNEDGLRLQAMDNSHVALVSIELNAESFIKYRCDRPMTLGANLASLTKVIKCAKDDDTVTLRAMDEPDTLHLTYEAKNTDRIAEYEMKLMDIDTDTLGIPETDYDATVKLSSSEFQRIVRDLSGLGESVRIEVTKEGVRFISEGESANGSILLKQSGGGKIERVKNGGVKKEDGADDDDDDDEDSGKKKKAVKVKKEARDDEDEEMEEDDGGSIQEASGSEAEPEEEDGDEEEGSGSKKRKRSSKSGAAAKKKTKTAAKKGKKKADDDDEEEEGGAMIHMNQHVNLTFSLKYLVNFAKSASLSKNVNLKMSNEVPLLVQFVFGGGFISYYLAPKIGDE
ncbi:proliferating cell nuclear antigen [Tulasnella sp. 424]|nr:proliferating cell nuclear antigen [Tulasnella sp. 424]